MNTELTAANGPMRVVEALFCALNSGSVSDALAYFDDDHFEFSDRALGLKFTERARLCEYFAKIREVFPDIQVRVLSAVECANYAIAEWELSATESYFVPGIRLPFSAPGISMARIENGKIKRWTDYYDEKTSRRLTVAARFRVESYT